MTVLSDAVRWLVFLGYLHVASSRGTMTLTSSCCTLTTGSCRSSCEEISLVDLATSNDERWRYISKLTSFCSQQLVPFWSCMNETLNEIDKGQGFFGRPCCALPQSQACIMVCLQAKSKEELTSACRPSDEVTFYTCLDRQEAGQECCSAAEQAECGSACRELFSGGTDPSTQMRTYASKACVTDSTHVQRCVRDLTLTTPARDPARNLHCCDKSPDADCRLACRNILRTQTIGQEIVDNLIDGGCGLPMPHDKLWQCFLTNADSLRTEPQSASTLDSLGMDSAKLQCCSRAATVTCQRLCIKTYSNEWESTWGDFDRQCQYQLAESPMLRCLAEVEEPCELGCADLSYCSAFSRRPTELFRSCDARTDEAARRDVNLWTRGVIHMPTADIPVLDVSSCRPEVWKAVACALHIKPCRGGAYAGMICRSDCLSILTECVDRNRLPDGQTPESLCDLLSPPGLHAPCTSLRPFLVASKYAQVEVDVSQPCNARTCGTSEVCLVNRNCRRGDVACSQHACVRGCRMGAVSQLVIPPDTFVQVPRLHRGKHCHAACRCGPQAELGQCAALPCTGKAHCTVLGREIPHQTQYFGNCTVCYCFAGELRCSKVCSEDSLYGAEIVSGSLCTCPTLYDPVCGLNGQTYHNPCVARCSGVKDMQPGRCSDSDPCRQNPCGSKKRCIIRRHTCLSVKRICHQYVCVATKDSCEGKGLSPVCDTENEKHDNVCILLQRKRTLGYFGKCLARCQRKGTVCGHDGQEYSSECSAWANTMSIDYRGSCTKRKEMADNESCAGVICQPLSSEHCTGITPPNTCCPICGAALKLIYSQKLLDQSLDAIQTTEPSSLSNLARMLQRHVKTVECELTAYLDRDQSIVALVLPSMGRPSALQVEACVQEAVKLQSLVEQRSPTLVTEIPLSSLVGGFLVQPTPDDANFGVARVAMDAATAVLALVLLMTLGNVT